jgi:hypothetical protein
VPYKPGQADYPLINRDQSVEVSNLTPLFNNVEDPRPEKKKTEFLGNFTLYKVNREF